jgi:hypothetical protein|tara:strand:- start:437 stop:601 length:165 start_codon:yes stop_codon:yes gene_type:complete
MKPCAKICFVENAMSTVFDDYYKKIEKLHPEFRIAEKKEIKNTIFYTILIEKIN